MALVGSAIGLGNLWRFPYLAGVNGGAAFIIIYIAFVFIICLPIMLAEFVVGRYGRFDQLAAEALRRAKERHPGIRLRLLIPYHPAQRPVDVPPGFDDTYYPEGMETVPKRLAILRAGQMAAGESGYLIASPGFGGSRTITDYALRREKRGLIQVTLLKAP